MSCAGGHKRFSLKEAAPLKQLPIEASPWVWEARPDVWLLIGSLALGYWWSVSRLRVKLPGEIPAPSRAVCAKFGSGLAILWLAVDWPMDRLGDDFLFSAHMVQFLLITLVSAPLLVQGVPGWLQLELPRPIIAILRYMARGPGALGVFQVVLVGTHLPAVVSLYTSNSLVHFSLHALWILAGCLFWLPLVGEEPVLRPLPNPLKVVYLIAASIVPTVPAGFLTWAQSPIYESYAAAPRVWGLSAVQDLQISGLVMKLGGGLILWIWILKVYVSWASSERPSGRAIRVSTCAGSAGREGVVKASRVSSNSR